MTDDDLRQQLTNETAKRKQGRKITPAVVFDTYCANTNCVSIFKPSNCEIHIQTLPC